MYQLKLLPDARKMKSPGKMEITQDPKLKGLLETPVTTNKLFYFVLF